MSADNDGTTETDTLQLAGMALANGVLMIGPTHWAATVRLRSGELATATRRRPQLGERITSTPVLRGPARLTEMLLVLPSLKRALPKARLPLESPALLSNAVVSGVAVRLLRRRLGAGIAVELAGSALSLGLLLATMRSAELAMYHGAEHKAIGGYEQHIAAEDASKEHERCGTHMAVPMLTLNAVAHSVARVALPRSPRAAAMIGSFAGVAASTELMRHVQRSGVNGVASRTVRTIGMRLQSVGSTREPTAEQLEVAEAALAALIDVESA